MQHDITDQIKDRAVADPVGAYERAGLSAGTLKRVGSVLQTLCPFHGDAATPSFTVYPKDGRWHCFGCDKHGDIIDFYQAMRKVPDFRRACEELVGILGVVPGVTPAHRPPARAAPPSRPDLPPLPFATVETLHQQLMGDAVKIAWLTRQKGLTEAIIADAKLGLGRGPCWREDRFAIPIMALDRLDTFLDIRGYRPGGKPKMLPWEKGRGQARLYPWPWVKHEGQICWVEGEIDALALLARGIAAVTATCGVNGALRVELPDLTGKRFVIIGDDDEQGHRLNAELPPRLLAAGAENVTSLSWEEVA